MDLVSVDPESLLRRIIQMQPVARLPALQELGPVGERLIELSAEAERWVIIDLDNALDASRALIDLADQSSDGGAQARTRAALAHALSYANQFDDALVLLEESSQLAVAAGDPVAAAKARLAMLHALARQGRYPEAIEAGEAARTLFAQQGESVLTARADINLGVTHRMRGEPAAALQHFVRAREGLDAEPILRAQLESNCAEALLDLNRFAEAEATFNVALQAFTAAGLDRGVAIVEGNLADLMSRQGRLRQALFHFERARRSIASDQAVGDAARLEAEQAEAFASAGLLDEAAECYAAALPKLDDHGLVWESARARTGLGRVLISLGREKDAQSVLVEAADAFQTLDHRAGLGQARLVQGEACLRCGDPDGAVDRLTQALTLLADRPAQAAVAMHHLAMLAIDANALQRAEELVETAIGSAQDLGLSPLLADLLHTRASLRSAQGMDASALADLQRAVGEIEKVRGSLQAERMRAAFIGGRTKVYEDLVLALLDASPDHVEGAFAVVEQAKSRSLLDLAAGAVDQEAITAAGDESRSLVDQVLELRRELNVLFSRLQEETGADRERISLLRSQVDRCSRRLQTLEARLASASGVGGLFAPPSELDAVQRMLGPDEVLIEYFVAGEEVMAFTVRRDAADVHRKLCTMTELEERVERALFQIARPLTYPAERANDPRLVADAQRELGTLHALLVEPLASDLGDAKRLYVVPHGSLHALPFHALHDGSGYLVERFEMACWASASLFCQRASTPSPAAGRSRSRHLVMGVADAVAPRIEEEARSVAAALGDARVYLGETATADCLAAQGADAGVIHLACHARFLPSSPLASGLRLGDGWLTVRDLYGLRLHDAVVVLSGCDTGRAAVSGADELVGLVRGFFAAGASAMVLSLWTLNDDTARDLMDEVYRIWHDGAGGSLSSALRSAQCSMMARRPHPVFWAPFILEGKT